MKFNYKRYSSNILRPVIRIGVGKNDQFVSYEVLVDSGADECIFDAQIAEAIGIYMLDGAPKIVYGITGDKQQFYVHPVTISVGGWKYEINAGFMEMEHGHGVVGQKGFFDLFTVKFDLLKEQIELTQRTHSNC